MYGQIDYKRNRTNCKKKNTFSQSNEQPKNKK